MRRPNRSGPGADGGLSRKREGRDMIERTNRGQREIYAARLDLIVGLLVGGHFGIIIGLLMAAKS